jgi:hypothetical protein
MAVLTSPIIRMANLMDTIQAPPTAIFRPRFSCFGSEFIAFAMLHPGVLMEAL